MFAPTHLIVGSRALVGVVTALVGLGRHVELLYQVKCCCCLVQRNENCLKELIRRSRRFGEEEVGSREDDRSC